MVAVGLVPALPAAPQEVAPLRPDRAVALAQGELGEGVQVEPAQGARAVIQKAVIQKAAIQRLSQRRSPARHLR